MHGAQTTEGNINDVQRDRDRVLVMEELHENHVNHQPGISKKEKRYFQNKLYQIFRVSRGRDTEMEGRLAGYNTLQNRLLWQKIRLEQKLGRMRTGTNWQPCHGPLVSEEKFREYMKLIEP